MDHDQRFKLLLQTFLREFLDLFFPEVARRIDFSQPVVWINQELFLDPPRGRKRVLDLVAQLYTLESPEGATTETLALLHIEIEGEDSVAELRGDMYHCYEVLRRHYRRPVLPLALYLYVGLEGRGTDVYEEHFWEYRTVRFEYQYVGLPALDAAAYAEGENLLGVALAPLMRMAEEVRAGLMARIFQRLARTDVDEVRKTLLGDCVLAYGNLTPQQETEMEQIMSTETYREGGVLRGSMLERALSRGQKEGQRRMLQGMLEVRFGPLRSQVLERLHALEGERLLELSREIVLGKTLTEMGLED